MLDVWHRPGNVHDRNGARRFILSCLSEMRQILRAAVLEVRMDCADRLQFHLRPAAFGALRTWVRSFLK